MGMKIGGFIEVLNVYNRRNTIEFIQNEGTFEIQGEEVTIEETRGRNSEGKLPLLPYIGFDA